MVLSKQDAAEVPTQTPPLFLGRAVEECVCRVLMESPGLVFPTAPLDVMSNGADNLLPLFDDELIPKDFMELV